MKGKSFNLSLTNLIYRLRRFDDIVRDELGEIMFDKELIIKDMVVNQQLYKQGINGQGEFIMDYEPYKPRTIKNKKKKGQPYNRVTLRDTGDFYRSIHLKRVAGGYGLVASDWKADKLLKKYRPTVLRLTNENLNILLREYIRPELVKRLKQRLNEN